MSYITVTPKYCEGCGIHFAKLSTDETRFCKNCKHFEAVHEANSRPIPKNDKLEKVWAQLASGEIQ
jgi:anaerobic ribonucleoside-triphosphate reductase